MLGRRQPSDSLLCNDRRAGAVYVGCGSPALFTARSRRGLRPGALHRDGGRVDVRRVGERPLEARRLQVDRIAATGDGAGRAAAHVDGRAPHVERNAGARRAKLRISRFTCLGPFSDADPNECAIAFVAGGRRLEGAFKPPSLRGVAENAPYMHTGEFRTLRDVLEHYNERAARERRAERAPSAAAERAGPRSARGVPQDAVAVLIHGEQIDHEHQRLVRLDHAAAGSSRAVRQR